MRLPPPPSREYELPDPDDQPRKAGAPVRPRTSSTRRPASRPMLHQATLLLTALQASNMVSLPTAFAIINGAPWPVTARNFAYDLAADAMPTGMGIHNVATTGCLYCTGRVTGPTPRDSVQHMLESCPYLTPLRDLLTELWACFPLGHWCTALCPLAWYNTLCALINSTSHPVRDPLKSPEQSQGQIRLI